MAGEKVGEAFVELHYKLDQLQKDLQAAKAQVQTQVGQLAETARRQTDGMLDGVKPQIAGISSSISTLRTLVVSAFAVQAVQAVAQFTATVVQAGSQVQQLRARLDQSLGAGAFDDVAASAGRLGIGIKDAADATSRFGLAAQDIGLTRAEVITLTETVAKLGRVGGSSAQEVSNGMIQLAQALASGKFQGDELRSVLESTPEVARAIARELGVGIGELRRMGTEGQLTADIVAGALLRAADDAAERFAALPESLEQSQARFENAATQLFAALDAKLRGSAIFQWFNQARVGFAEGLTVDLGGGSADTRIRVLQERLTSLQEGNWIGENNRLIEEVDAQLDEARRLKREMQQLETNRTAAAPPERSQMFPVEKVDPTIATSRANRREVDQRIAAERLRDQQKAAADAEREQKRTNAETARLNREAEQEQKRAAAEEKRQLDEASRQINDAADARWAAQQQLANQRRDATLEALAEEEKRLKESDPRAYYEQTGDTEFARIYSPAAGAKEALQELGEESMRYGEMMGNGIRAGADLVASSLTQMATTGKLAIDDLLKSIADLAVSMAIEMGVKAAFGAAGNYFGGTGTAGNGQAAAAGFARGGVFDHGNVVPLARGGIVSAATIVPLARGAALMGEAGPEAVMPLGRDSQGRLGVRGGGGGGTVVNVIDQRGAGAPPVETQRSTGGDGREQITLMIRAEVERAVGSGGMNQVMEQTYGIKPRTRR